MSMLQLKNINNFDEDYVINDNRDVDFRLSFDYKSLGQ